MEFKRWVESGKLILNICPGNENSSTHKINIPMHNMYTIIFNLYKNVHYLENKLAIKYPLILLA